MGEPGLFDGGMMPETMAAHHRPVNSGHAREAAGSSLIRIQGNRVRNSGLNIVRKIQFTVERSDQRPSRSAACVALERKLGSDAFCQA
jgi:hypothetical protein